MAGSQEPASPEPDTQEFTTMEPDPANDIEMADTDHPIEQDEPMIDSPEAEIALPESNALGTAEIEPSTPENIDMMESDPPVEQGESSPDKPAAETALPESNDADIHGYNPSMTDDLDTFNDFGAADLSEMLPKPEPEPSQNDAFGHLEAEPVTPRDASPTESVRPLDLREASLGKSRSEKALSEEGAHDQAPADFVGSGHVSPVESVHDSASAAFGSPNRLFPIESANSDDAPAAFDDFGYVSPTASVHDDAPAPFDGFNNVSLVESVGDAVAAHPSASNSALPTESIQSIDLGRSALGKPKQVLNLGTSSLSKPASQASRDKAKALQVRLAKQFAEKSAAKTTSDTSGLPSSADAGESIFSAPSNFFSPHGAGGSAFSTTSDNFTPSEFDEPMRDVHPDQAEFEAFQEAYLLKKQAGTNDIESDVAFLKAEAKESARKRKAETDEQHEREPSPEAEAESESNTLFVTPTVRTPASHAPASSEGGFGEDAFFTSAPKPSKRKGGASGDMAPPKKKQSKKTGRSLGGKRGKDGLNDQEINETLNTMQMRMQNGSKVPIAQPAAAKKTTKTSSRGPVPNVSNVDSMLAGTDVFADTQAVAGHSNQPGFKAGTARKDHALRDLIASVPQDERPAAAGDKKFLETSLKDFDGQGSCKPSEDGSGWTLRGMKCTLKHYQVLGIAFMRKRENHKEHPRGGILADEMGLGKTIQMIANIINGKPKQGQPRTTLIVASPALISQWYAEILKFTMNPKENKKHGIARIIQHRAGYRQGGDDAQIKEAIMESDICLTTYSEINKSYPKADVPAEITTDRGKAEWWRSHFQENKGVFHDMKFLRVVLDEAQAIKNHTSHCSMSCRALISEYYWAISGTPLVNGITEMYPYLKFLRHPHTGSMRTFQANFCSPNDPTGSEKLGVFLRQIIIRRTHKDLLFGARLLDLPTPKQNVIYLEFNAVERTVYEIVKQRFIQRINTITRRDGINGGSVQYSHIWTMLLRLRQICCHVLLIQGTIMDLLEREDYQKLDDITREFEGHSEDSDNVLKHLRTMLEVHKIAAKDGEDPEVSVAGVDVDVVPGLSNTIGGPELSLGKNHGKSYPFQKYLTTVAQSEQMAEVEARMTCCWCGEKPDMAQITSCHHIYCKPCMRKMQHAAARNGRPFARCNHCGEPFHNVEELKSIGNNQSHETDASQTSSGGSQGDAKKGKKTKDEVDWIGQPGRILPSAKTVACKAQILAWLSEASDCKIIVYTQFLPMIRIMGRVCQGEGWGHLKYSGNMSQPAREKALKEFALDPDKKIMLMSLKCGGLGLNIVAASRVLLLDPWWNDAIEQQAFCRVFRIGQVNETRLTRLCIKNSMDSAMFAVKERKTAEIDKVMDESKAGPRSVQELLALFGPVGEDEDGRPGFIFPDVNENETEEEVAGRFFERAAEGTGSFYQRGQGEGFMGNDV